MTERRPGRTRKGFRYWVRMRAKAKCVLNEALSEKHQPFQEMRLHRELLTAYMTGRDEGIHVGRTADRPSCGMMTTEEMVHWWEDPQMLIGWYRAGEIQKAYREPIWDLDPRDVAAADRLGAEEEAEHKAYWAKVAENIQREAVPPPADRADADAPHAARQSIIDKLLKHAHRR